MKPFFQPYRPGSLEGLRWGDADKSGRRNMTRYMDQCLERGGIAEVLVADGRIMGGGGLRPDSPDCWHSALAMVEGAPRPLWRHMLVWADGWFAHAVRRCGVRMIDTHVTSTFAEGHHLVALLGYRFVGLDHDGDRLLFHYRTNGPVARPAVHPEVERAMRLAHDMALAVYAPEGLRAVKRVRGDFIGEADR